MKKQFSRMKRIFQLIKLTFQEWGEDNGGSLSAALAYYTIFSLAPLLVIAVAVAGLFFGREAAQGGLVDQIDQVVGQQGGELVESIIVNASAPTKGGLAAALGLLTLLFGATGAFSEMQNSMNHIWDQPRPPKGGIMAWVRNRLVSFLLVMGTGLILLASLLVGAVLAAASQALEGVGISPVAWQAANQLATLVLLTVAFAIIYRALPDTKVAWRDVWPGAILASGLFAIARLVLNFYLANNSTVSAYGAAGSLIVLLIWIYFSAQILFLGAEFSQVYARLFGSRQHEAENVLEEKPEQKPARKPPAPAPSAPARTPATAWQAQPTAASTQQPASSVDRS